MLLALSRLLVGALELLRLPAALLIGPLIAAAILTAFDVTVHVPPSLFSLAHGVVGCLIARVLAPTPISAMARDWPTFIGAALSVVAASVGLGLVLARLRVLPGTTAVWGAFPGAATVMTLMAEGFGADVRLVALLQSLRVAMVTVTTAAVAGVFATKASPAPAPSVWFPPVAWPPLAATLALVLAAATVGRIFRIPAGPMLLAFAAGALMQNLGLM